METDTRVLDRVEVTTLVHAYGSEPKMDAGPVFGLVRPLHCGLLLVYPSALPPLLADGARPSFLPPRTRHE